MRKWVSLIAEGSVDNNSGCFESSSSIRTLSTSSCLDHFADRTDDTPPGISTSGIGQKSHLARSQAKRRLELEANDPQELQDGGRTNKAKKEKGGGKTPASSPIAGKPPFEKSRYDTSLGLLTRRFADLLRCSADRVLDLNEATQKLNAHKRRVYDVTNVLEGIHLIKKKSKNTVEWLGSEMNLGEDQGLPALIEEERKLDELIQTCTQQVLQMCEDRHIQRFAYLTYEDIQRIASLKEQTVIVIKAPAETKLEVSHPEESFQIYLTSTRGPIEVFLCSDDPIPMEATDASGSHGNHLNSSASGNDSSLLLASSSLFQVSSKDDANHSLGISNVSNLLSEPTQNSSAFTVSPVCPMPTSLKLHKALVEDQQNFVTLSPPLAFSLDGNEYLLNLAANEGITDLYSPVDLDCLPLCMPLL